MASSPAAPQEGNLSPNRVVLLLRMLGSLKLAVALLVILAVVCAVTTFVESKRGTELVQWYVYDHPWFAGLLSLLALNVLAATLARFPWNRRQIGFVLTHVGVLMVLIGSLLTYWFGIEGRMAIAEGEQQDSIVLNGRTQVTVYRPGDRKRESLEFSFYGGPVGWSEDHALDLAEIDGVAVKVLKFYRQAQREERWVADDSDRAPAAMKVAIVDPEGRTLGQRWLQPDQFNLKAEVGDQIEIGGGGKIVILESLPHARQEVEFQSVPLEKDGPSGLEPAALIEVTAAGTTHKIWLQRNDPQFGFQRIETARGPLQVELGYERLPLGFSLKLHDFTHGRNPGGMGSASYESSVQLIDKAANVDQRHKIWMNHPLTHRNFSFYQSSYQELTDGKEVSILSAAYDPGRLLKYSGSVVVCVGMFVMFYIRTSGSRKTTSAATAENSTSGGGN